MEDGAVMLLWTASSPTMDALGGALGQFVRPDGALGGGGLAGPGSGPGLLLTVLAVVAATTIGVLAARPAGRR